MSADEQHALAVCDALMPIEPVDEPVRRLLMGVRQLLRELPM